MTSRIVSFVLTLGTAVLASSVPAPSPALAREKRPAALGDVDPFVFDNASPSARLIASRADQAGAYRYYVLQNVGDLDRDGIDDLVVQVYDITSAPTDVRFTSSTGTLTVYARSGRTGKRLWSHSQEYADGSAGVMPLRAGDGPVDGVLVFKHEAASAAYAITLTALDGSGTELWSQTVTSSYNFYTGAGYLTPAGAATDAPTTFHPYNGVEGPAQDMLLAVSDYVVSNGNNDVGSTDVKAIDGTDGALVEYPISATSTEMVPIAESIADVTGDALDDIVVLTKDSGRHLVLGYDSTDSSSLWEEETSFTDAAYTRRMPDLTGDGRRDFLIAFQRGTRHVFRVVDAVRGRVAWSGRAWAPYPLGRVDGDRRQDVGGFVFVAERRRQGARFLAFSADGRRLYSRRHLADVSGCGRNCFLFSFLLQAGDLNADGVKDRYVTQILVGGDSRSRDDYIVNGSNGRKLYRRKLLPVMGNLDGRGAGDLATVRRKSDGIVVRAFTGKHASPIWRTRVRVPGFKYLTDRLQPYDAAARLDRDGCDDLLLWVKTDRGVRLIALGGRTGRLKWSSGIEDGRKPRVAARRLGPTSC